MSSTAFALLVTLKYPIPPRTAVMALTRINEVRSLRPIVQFVFTVRLLS
jgi:hypothetical protein